MNYNLRATIQMDREKHKLLLSKWEKVEDFQRLASELFKETNGDARKLTSGTYTSKNGAFGRVSNTLFGENEELHRFLLWTIWKSNKGTIRVNWFGFNDKLP